MKRSYLTLLLVLLISINGFSQQLNKAKLDSLMNLIESKNKGMGSLSISKNGQSIYSKAIGKAQIKEGAGVTSTLNTKYRVGSITKMFTGVLIFQLIEKNKLKLETTLDQFFPSFPNGSNITIDNLLNHRSGIHNFTNDSLYLTYYQQPKTQKEMLDIIAAAPLDFEPGAKASYSNSNYLLLGWIAEQLTRKSYAQLVEENIVKKLKLNNTYVGGKTNIDKSESYSYSYITNWKQEAETDMSIPGAAGAIVSTPADLLKFIEGLFEGKLINAASLAKMKDLKDNYGRAMFSFPFGDRKAYGHNGGIDGFVSMLGYFPEEKLAVAYVSNGMVYPVNDILIGVLSIYFDVPYTLPSFEKVVIQGVDLDKYLGVYSSPQIPLKVTITKEGDQLIAQATGQGAFPLEPTVKDHFKFDQAGVAMEFNPAKNEMTLRQGGTSYLFTKDK